ncbi:transglutaminase-like domain-containing protein [Thauera aromatica]|uniref:Transglutaminase-like domain n=1 Tax=Thauera aromatica K172 TaxID=44139 RepID=A0A2R4BL46_THAAR|nr:transglutaminase family protein [Thauera aromatica]AVR87982.1 Transglutaminase-like domain [Thauera aromatica K172]
MSSNNDMQAYLAPSDFFDFHHPRVRDFIDEAVGTAADPVDRAVRLYYAVRDGVRYDPYRFYMRKEYFVASRTVAEGAAYCVPKAILLAAAARGAGIPARVGFADVRNHLSTERLRQLVGGDLYRWHGYVALHLEGRWVKATPAFNLQMCERFDVKPLEFNGRDDSLMHPYNARDERHMEYVNDRGVFDDFPFEELVDDMRAFHPHLVDAAEASLRGDFEHEAMVDR